MKKKYYLRGLGFGILVTTLVFILVGGSGLSDEEIGRRAEQLGYTKQQPAGPTKTPSGIDWDALRATLTPQPTEGSNSGNALTPTTAGAGGNLAGTLTPQATDAMGNTLTPKPTEAGATGKPVPTDTPMPTPTAKPVPTDTPTPKPTPTNTPTPRPTATNTPTPRPTATNTPTPRPTATNTPMPRPTAANTPTPTAAAGNTPTPGETQKVTAKIQVKPGMGSSEVCILIARAGIVKDWKDLNQYMMDHVLTDYINVGTFTLSSDMSYQEIAHILTGH